MSGRTLLCAPLFPRPIDERPPQQHAPDLRFLRSRVAELEAELAARDAADGDADGGAWAGVGPIPASARAAAPRTHRAFIAPSHAHSATCNHSPTTAGRLVQVRGARAAEGRGGCKAESSASCKCGDLREWDGGCEAESRVRTESHPAPPPPDATFMQAARFGDTEGVKAALTGGCSTEETDVVSFCRCCHCCSGGGRGGGVRGCLQLGPLLLPVALHVSFSSPCDSLCRAAGPPPSTRRSAATSASCRRSQRRARTSRSRTR